MITIRYPQLPAEQALVHQLFTEYAQGLEIDLAFQDFDTELASLPGKYAPPTGRLLLAFKQSAAVGCVALRSLAPEVGEIKRLYVQPQARGVHVGRQLVERICQEARYVGYQRLYLDTLPNMQAAFRLYLQVGFKPIKPYVFNPVPGALFLGLNL